MKTVLYIILILLFISSCTTVRYRDIPIETINTLYITNTLIDSVFIHDSIDRYTSGDTLYITKYRDRYRYINKIDTVVKKDTIIKLIKEPQILILKVNEINKTQKTLMLFGVVFIILCIIFIYKKLGFKLIKKK